MKDKNAHEGAKADSSGAAVASPPRKCGLVMPISGMEGLPASHWAEIKEIIIDSLPNWSVSLVSEGDDAGVIQTRIVERLYSDTMVVADVSGRNPNVMFELGMRLAFDKPTVIVKDEITLYPFDVGPNEYVEYPRDLRFSKIVAFKRRLAEKVEATAKPEHKTFLRSFGPFKVAKIETREVPAEQLILDRLDHLERGLRERQTQAATRDAESELVVLRERLLASQKREERARLEAQELRLRLDGRRISSATAEAIVNRVSDVLLSEGCSPSVVHDMTIAVISEVGTSPTTAEIKKWYKDYLSREAGSSRVISDSGKSK